MAGRKLRVGALVVLLVAGGAGAALWQRQGAGAEAAALPPTLEFTPAEVVQPTRARLPGVIDFSGPLVAPQTAVVRAKAAGTLTTLNVAEGDRVRAGQTLGTLDLADLATRVAERSALLQSAQVQVAQAERTHAANQRLADQNYISPNALEGSRATLDAAQAALDAARAQLGSTRVGLRDAALVAPIAGVVARRQALPGEKLSLEQPVLTLVDLRRLELAGSVGTHEVAALAPGMPVEVRIEGVAQPVAARLARIAPAAEAGTRAIGVTITLDNPTESYRAGQYALARVALPDPTERLTLPSAAIGDHAGQPMVWLIEGGVLARRAIVTGRRDEAQGRVEVLGGVAADAQVLALRFDNLREGAKAAVVAAASSAASSVASAASPSAAR